MSKILIDFESYVEENVILRKLSQICLQNSAQVPCTENVALDFVQKVHSTRFHKINI